MRELAWCAIFFIASMAGLMIYDFAVFNKITKLPQEEKGEINSGKLYLPYIIAPVAVIGLITVIIGCDLRGTTQFIKFMLFISAGFALGYVGRKKRKEGLKP